MFSTHLKRTRIVKGLNLCLSAGFLTIFLRLYGKIGCSNGLFSWFDWFFCNLNLPRVGTFFSTLLPESKVKGKIAKYIGKTFQKIADEYEWEIDEMSVQEDHVHLFLHVPPKYAPAGEVQIMKSISAREVFEKYPELRKQLWAGEFWSDGYIVRSVGDKVTAEMVKAYIRQQEEDGKPQQLRLWD